jgi:hypothetical protein
MPARKVFLTLLALGSGGLALWVLFEAVVSDHLTGQVFYAIVPLVMLVSVAVNGLKKGD